MDLPRLPPFSALARPLALAALLVLGAATGGAQTGDGAARGSAATAWFTAAQADAGQRAFNTHCAACHGSSMLDIFRGYATVERYYNFISGSMPRHLPGSLPETDYLSVVAYLLRTSGFAAGERELTAERAQLRRIVPADGLAH
jgi:hypothetical protein